MPNHGDECTIGPLMCGALDCRPDDDDDDDDDSNSDTETTTLFSGIRRRRTKRTQSKRRTNKSLSSVYDDPAIQRRALTERLALFQSKGWLSQQEYRKYTAYLSTFDDDDDSSYLTRTKRGNPFKELETELNLLEDRNTSVWKKMVATPPRRASKGLTPKGGNGGRARPLAVATSRVVNELAGGRVSGGIPSIVDPADLARSMSEHHISELFVEVCFFARLGFVQPPCCLQCTYREAMSSTAPNVACKRWVIWRRNARNPLHPHHLCDNAIAVQCHAARKLVAGKTVDGYRWDKMSKTLIVPSYVRQRKRTCA